MRINSIAPTKPKKMPSRFIAGLAAFLATGIITASGLAGATPNNSNGSSHNQTTNNHQNGTINNGYGGGNKSIINNINLNINGSNNIVTVIVRIVF